MQSRRATHAELQLTSSPNAYLGTIASLAKNAREINFHITYRYFSIILIYPYPLRLMDFEKGHSVKCIRLFLKFHVQWERVNKDQMAVLFKLWELVIHSLQFIIFYCLFCTIYCWFYVKAIKRKCVHIPCSTSYSWLLISFHLLFIDTRHRWKILRLQNCNFPWESSIQ